MDALEHVVEPHVLRFIETLLLVVGVSDELEDLQAHHVHDREVPVPKVMSGY